MAIKEMYDSSGPTVSIKRYHYKPLITIEFDPLMLQERIAEGSIDRGNLIPKESIDGIIDHILNFNTSSKEE